MRFLDTLNVISTGVLGLIIGVVSSLSVPVVPAIAVGGVIGSVLNTNQCDIVFGDIDPALSTDVLTIITTVWTVGGALIFVPTIVPPFVLWMTVIAILVKVVVISHRAYNNEYS